MGMSANQARFLSLTSRQVDLEYRMQQICHRRLRLASELEKIATKYNNALSDRQMFASNQTMYEKISLSNLNQLGFRVIDKDNNMVNNLGLINHIEPGTNNNPLATKITSQEQFFELINKDGTGDIDLDGDYELHCDIDMAEFGPVLDAVIGSGSDAFTGTFDGNGYTISNLEINRDNVGVDWCGGFFNRLDGATVNNLIFDNATLNNQYNGNSYSIGILTGLAQAGSSVDNVAVINSKMNLSTDSNGAGLLVGAVHDGSVVSNSYASGIINLGHSNYGVGGFVGQLGGTITGSYSDVDIIADPSMSDIDAVGGFLGVANTGVGSNITNSYSAGSIMELGSGSGSSQLGGFVGVANSSLSISDSYTTTTVSTNAASSVNGFAGANSGTIDNTNFYMNNLSTDTASSNAVNGNTAPLPTETWDSAVWNKEYTPPTLGDGNIDSLEEGLRNGSYSLVREADNYTQDALTIDGIDYEKVDWRTVPTIDDDLYKANDTDAEAEYDSAIEKINSQDKKLQLEQSQVEVEHKAIVTQKDAVKNILNKNIESSFKTFS